MNTRHHIAAGLLALTAASLASATEIVRVAGSTAFRSSVVQAEVDSLSNTGPNLPGGVAQVSYDGSNYSGATSSLCYGYLADHTTEVYFINNWTGSAAGLVDLTSGNTALKFMPITVAKSVLPGTKQTAGTDYTADTAAPSVAMSDVSSGEAAASIATQGTAGRNFAAKITAAALADGGTAAGPVAVCTFQYVLGALDSALTTAPFTNITQNQAASLIKNGSLSLGAITGNSADNSSFVFWLGRNEDSGTRIIAFADAQTGFGQSAAQWMLKQDALPYPANNLYASLSRGTSITGLQLWTKNWPVNTVPTLNWNTKGHSGYNGGGDVAAVLQTSNPVTGFTVASNPDLPTGWIDGTSRAYFVSCLGAADAAKIINNTGGINGTALTYNGVAYSKANVINGTYSCWGFEHLYYLTAATGTQVAIGTGQGAADALANTVDAYSSATIGTAGLKTADLSFSRTGTGAPIH